MHKHIMQLGTTKTDATTTSVPVKSVMIMLSATTTTGTTSVTIVLSGTTTTAAMIAATITVSSATAPKSVMIMLSATTTTGATSVMIAVVNVMCARSWRVSPWNPRMWHQPLQLQSPQLNSWQERAPLFCGISISFHNGGRRTFNSSTWNCSILWSTTAWSRVLLIPTLLPTFSSFLSPWLSLLVTTNDDNVDTERQRSKPQIN